MSKLILMSGIPGAGKTTYAKNVAGACVISNDDIRFELTGGVFIRQKEWNKLPIENIQEQRIIEASQQYDTVILDCTALTNEKRFDYYRKYSPYFDEFELVFMNTPFWVCVRRNYNRKKKVPFFQILKMKFQLEDIDNKIRLLFDTKIKKG